MYDIHDEKKNHPKFQHRDYMCVIRFGKNISNKVSTQEGRRDDELYCAMNYRTVTKSVLLWLQKVLYIYIIIN